MSDDQQHTSEPAPPPSTPESPADTSWVTFEAIRKNEDPGKIEYR